MTSRAGSPERGGANASGRGEREDLDAATGSAGEHRGERVNGARGELGVGVRLDLELEHEIARRDRQQRRERGSRVGSVAGGQRVDGDGDREDERGVLARCDLDAVGLPHAKPFL